jgi:hypothetical protein
VLSVGVGLGVGDWPKAAVANAVNRASTAVEASVCNAVFIDYVPPKVV